jgi:hypothetical protein
MDIDMGENVPAAHEVLNEEQLNSMSTLLHFFSMTAGINFFFLKNTVRSPLFCAARRPVDDMLPVNDLGPMNIQSTPVRKGWNRLKGVIHSQCTVRPSKPK